MKEQTLCLGCMERYDEQHMDCPRCGYRPGTPHEPGSSALPAGCVLANGKYLIGKVLGQGGFGITYIGYDTKLKVKLAIKEFFPRHLVSRRLPETHIMVSDLKSENEFKDGFRYFLREAQTAAQFEHHPNVVAVRDYFEENTTAYMVMSYIEGKSLGDMLERNRLSRFDFNQITGYVGPVMDALERIHHAKLLHRDISPENIYITKDGQAKLIDFGAARYTFGSQTQSMSLILKEGYAPLEQYSKNGNQGPWTDIYAMAATVYRSITGKVPPPPMERLQNDPLMPPSKMGIAIPGYAEKALLKALSIRIDDRYQSMSEFKHDLVRENRKTVQISLLTDKRTAIIIAAVVLVVIIGAAMVVMGNKEEKIPDPYLKLLEKDNPTAPETKKAAADKNQTIKTPPAQKQKEPPEQPKDKNQKKEATHAVTKEESRAKQPQAVQETSLPQEPKKAEQSEVKQPADTGKIPITAVQNKDKVMFIRKDGPKVTSEELFKEALKEEKIGSKGRALDYYGEACRAEYALACYKRGLLASDNNNLGAARRLFEKECDDGKSNSCLNLGLMLIRAEGAPKNQKDQNRGIELISKLCEMRQSAACLLLGSAFESGKNLPANAVLAGKYYQKGCDLNDKQSCYDYAQSILSGRAGGSAGDAAEYVKKACSLGHPKACQQMKKQ